MKYPEAYILLSLPDYIIEAIRNKIIKIELNINDSEFPYVDSCGQNETNREVILTDF